MDYILVRANNPKNPVCVNSAPVSTWGPLPIGAGGFIRDIDIAPDGTFVAKTDTYGAYIWNPNVASPGNAGGMGVWQQLCTPTRIPAGDPAYSFSNRQKGNLGVYAIRIAPSNSSTFYMMWNGYFYVSTNKGAPWTNCTNFATQTSTNASANNNYAQYGPKMAVDPANANIVFVGCANLYATANGTSVSGGVSLATFATVSTGSIPEPTTTGAGYAICFDPTSAVTGGATQGIYIGSYGNGFYHSANAGSSWSSLSGGPTTFRRAVVDKFGTLWVTADNGSDTNLYSYTSVAGWTNITGAKNSEPFHSIAPDPASSTQGANRIILGDTGGTINQTLDNGGTWTGPYFAGFPSGSGTLVANDIPWLSKNEAFLDNGNMMFDTSVVNTLRFGEGIGPWWSNPPTTYTGNWDWNSQAAGIEQLVAVHIFSPPGGYVCAVNWDRPIFCLTNQNAYPSDYGLNYANQIVPGWGGDYASSDPSFVCLNCPPGTGGPGYSNSDGEALSWSIFGSLPSGSYTGGGGLAIAASTPNNIVLVNAAGTLENTTDGGANWNACDPVGSGWLDPNEPPLCLCADRVTANTFYAFNGNGNIYVSSTSGNNGTWTSHSPGFSIGQSFVPNIEAVPGNAGHVFISFGQSTVSSHPDTSSKFYRSTNGGANWSDVSNGSFTIREVQAFGIGAINGGGYPAIGLYGWINGTLGFWVSNDDCNTWTMIGDAQFGYTFDMPVTVSGDMNTPGVWYVGMQGSGYIRYAT